MKGFLRIQYLYKNDLDLKQLIKGQKEEQFVLQVGKDDFGFSVKVVPSSHLLYVD